MFENLSVRSASMVGLTPFWTLPFALDEAFDEDVDEEGLGEDVEELEEPLEWPEQWSLWGMLTRSMESLLSQSVNKLYVD